MQKNQNGQFIFSPSDLVVFMRSKFATWLDRYALEQPEKMHELGITKSADPMMELLAEKGNAFESDYLHDLKQKHGESNIGIVSANDSDKQYQETLDFMRQGLDIIYQGRLERENFSGKSDFLFKVAGNSKFGNYHYEVWDTKLALSTRPYFLVQLCCYSWMLEEIQGVLPTNTAIILGDKTKNDFFLLHYYGYFQQLKTNFLQLHADFKADLLHLPDPALFDEHGCWSDYAKKRLVEIDSLGQIAGIRKSQIKKFHKAQIHTMTALLDISDHSAVSIPKKTVEKLKNQANIQHESKGLDRPKFKVISNQLPNGLASLPPESTLDVYFDIEGHPLFDGGLEYLWGVTYKDENAPQGKSYAFKDWWAHTPQQEKLAFENFIDWIYARWKADKTMHVYHYASYEITAMRKISSCYETRLEKVSELLTASIFVDLYKIVSKGLLIGTTSYSLKKVESLYRESKRETDVANGGDSVVAYEFWRDQGGVERWNNQENGYLSWLKNPEKFDWSHWKELDEIRSYNIDDCESTLELVAWLRKQQKAAGLEYEPVAIENNVITKELSGLEKRRQELKLQFESDEKLKNDPTAQLIVNLMGFHSRERKPKAWAYYDRLEKTHDELIDDDTCICDIEILDHSFTENGLLYRGIFNNQQPVRTDKFETKNPAFPVVANILETEDIAKNINFFPCDKENKTEIIFIAHTEIKNETITLFANEVHISTSKLETRLCDVADDVFNGELSGVTKAILKQEKPLFNISNALPINRKLYTENDEYLAKITAAVREMKECCLCIQGPPGSGKTFTASHVIATLAKEGKRIGVMSNSHAAILNLFASLSSAGISDKEKFLKIGGSDATNFKNKFPQNNFYYVSSINDLRKANPYTSFSVIGATAFAFAYDVAFNEPLDYLFVDEASQVSLANLVAILGATKRVVLMGDQMQLEQPTQGQHPEGAGQSVLETLLNGYNVVPEDRGIFLETTYRMHPSVCQPVSKMIYDGKLYSASGTENQKVILPNPMLIQKPHGVLTINVEHENNRQSSLEEVQIIEQLLSELKTGSFTNKSGQIVPITNNEILIIAPYNMQVNLLKKHFGAHYRIGTIDKFQGQEAPVVIISMAVSNPEEAPRGIDFIFDLNRLNVAVSRAKALALIVSNPHLKNSPVNHVIQMKKLSVFQHFCE